MPTRDSIILSLKLEKLQFTLAHRSLKITTLGYLGAARGALRDAAQYVPESTRPSLHSDVSRCGQRPLQHRTLWRI